MVQQLIANMMNDPSFNPTSRVLPDLHSGFSEPRDLSKDLCMTTIITPNQSKTKQADLRVKNW